MTTNKDKAFRLIQDEQLFCTDFFYYGKSVPFVLTFVCQHPQWGYPMCFDLKSDPGYYFNLSIQQLKKELAKKPKVIRTIKHKKHPIIMNSNYGMNFDSYKQLGIKKLKERIRVTIEKKSINWAVFKLDAKIVPITTPKVTKIPYDLTISKFTALYFMWVKVEAIEVGIIIENEVPTAKCIIKDLSNPKLPKI